MSLHVHPELVAEKLAEGWVVVKDDPRWVALAHPDYTCLRPMRDGPCLLDADHKGRHSTVVFFCDGCQKSRRGQPHRVIYDRDGIPDVTLCFYCQVIEARSFRP